LANNSLIASDTFASGSLAAGWSVVTGFLKSQVIAGSPNVTEPNALSTQTSQIWTGLPWPNDQISEAVVQTLTAEAGTYLLLLARIQSGAYSGYQVNIDNNTLQVIRYDNGTPTGIASATGLTFASGDVWTFEATGAVLSVYQNMKRITYAIDTTYTSGSVGYGQLSSVNITHTQVSTWRGYNLIQTDGIWTKKGITVPAIASDFAASGYGVYQPCVIADSNPQLLAGSPVLKMWLSGGGLGSNIYYLESAITDGVNWTRRGAAVLNSFSEEAVLKYNNTYYMFSQASASPGTSDINLHTSPDGLAWTLNNAHVLSPGGVGTWDATGFYMVVPPILLNGTWYMLYIGAASGSNGLNKLGIATSSSLTGSWTKYAGNPVLSNMSAACNVVKVGNNFYLWGIAGPTSPQRNDSVQFFDPGEGIRYQSTNLLNWTNPIMSVHHSQIVENVNGNGGGCSPQAIIDVNGLAYMYTGSSPADAAGGADGYQIGLAVAASSIENIVLQREDAIQPLASDNFSYGAGSLSASWSTLTGNSAMQVTAGNLAEGTSTVGNSQAIYAGTFSPNQYSEITLATLNSGCYMWAIVRGSLSANTCYQGVIIGPTGSLGTPGVSGSAYIIKAVSGSNTTLSPFVAITPEVGDVIRLTVITTPIGNVLSLFQNNHLVVQAIDYASSINSGQPGMAVYSGVPVTGSQISLWAGGNSNVIPNYPTFKSSHQQLRKRRE
jgi:hypothetical protein